MLPARPIDAAGLVLLRRTSTGEPEVLLGRRHPAVRFMPDIYVFPGGRVEPEDANPSGFREDLNLFPEGVDQATRRRLLPLARAALRETWEETGLLCGTPHQDSKHRSAEASGAWRAFEAARLAPAFCDLRLIARAITPRDSPVRFHTRFFIADGELARGTPSGDGELEDIGWVRASETTSLPMAKVNRFVLSEALARWQRPGAPVALYYHRKSRPRTTNAQSGPPDFRG